MTRHLLTTALAFNAVLSSAPGKLVLDGNTYVLSHVYARKGPATFEPNKVSTYVLAADRELPADVRVDEDAIREMFWDGKLNSVEIEITDSGLLVHPVASGEGQPLRITVSGSLQAHDCQRPSAGNGENGKTELGERYIVLL
jgi:hypothetical protein